MSFSILCYSFYTDERNYVWFVLLDSQPGDSSTNNDDLAFPSLVSDDEPTVPGRTACRCCCQSRPRHSRSTLGCRLARC